VEGLLTITALFVGGLIALFVGGEALVRGASSIGVRFGMSPMIVGLTIVAFATSAPELAVALGAALRDEPGLAVGNVVGSNICNLTLIVGIVVLLSRPALRNKLVRLELTVLVTSTIVASILLLDQGLSRIEGLLLVGGIVVYIFVAVRRLRGSSKKISAEELESSVPSIGGTTWTQALFCAAGIGVLVLGSHWLVEGSVRIALLFNISPAIVGLTAAAIGTSLPEIAASIVAARHNHADLAAGNLIGSNIFNLLLVLGGTAAVRPLGMGSVSLVDIVVMCATTILSLSLMFMRSRLIRIDGVLLIGIYFAYIVTLVNLATAP
jgi:cation:H+ antiporter